METEGSRTLITGLQDQGSPVELRPRIAVVRSEGIAPSSPACRTGTLLLSYDPVAEGGGLEPPTPVLRRTQLAPALLVLPDSFQNTRGGGGGSRTPRPWLITIFGTVALTDRQLLQRLATRVRRRSNLATRVRRRCGREGRGSRTPKAPRGAHAIFQIGAVAHRLVPSSERGRGPPPGRPRSTVHHPSTGPARIPPPPVHAASGSASISPVQYR